jgi:hypothetical protein
MKDNIILIPTCNKYSDAWEPFRRLANVHWPSHPPMVLASDEIADERAVTAARFARVLVTGSGQSWCKVFAEAVAHPDEQMQYVILLQEDFLLHRVDEPKVEAALAYMRANPRCVCFRLYPCPGADGKALGPWYGEITRDVAYRVSCQTAIWRTEYLSRLLLELLSFIPGATAADFELRGTPISRSLPGEFVSANNGVYVLQYLCSAITRGEWTRDGVKLCETVGIDATKTGRAIMAQ